jgi:hypothetical protein
MSAEVTMIRLASEAQHAVVVDLVAAAGATVPVSASVTARLSQKAMLVVVTAVVVVVVVVVVAVVAPMETLDNRATPRYTPVLNMRNEQEEAAKWLRPSTFHRWLATGTAKQSP